MVAYRRREYTIASVLVWMQVSNGLLPPQTNHGRSSPCCRRYKYRILFREATFPDECLTVFASGEDNNEIGSQWNPENDDDRVIIRGSEYDDIDGSIWEDLETGQPPKWLVMKELLGINAFTYILAVLIAFFLSMNYFIGPGWLGSMLGVPGTGVFNEVSESLPDTIDLSSPEFRL